MPVPVHIDKSEGLFPMRGFGQTGRRRVPSARPARWRSTQRHQRDGRAPGTK